ncbi:alpha-glucan family phosphorylase [Pendulispora brunnea]|uniref:Alpha-glucan family phosphorylase n=1 Tax=Pendulispora brunnea TaxID=2905690 RepID=A0ABZ2K5V4_9BACT
MNPIHHVAYLSMEMAIDARIPTYAGGLGVLAGDMLRSCADLAVPVVAVTLLWRAGYFEQRLDESGAQTEEPTSWEPESLLTSLPARVQVQIEGRTVNVRVFQHEIAGASGYTVPVLFLDTDLAENSPEDRRLTDALYGGDAKHRLAQEIVLGLGGVRALRACGFDRVTRFHLNEGHAALAALELYRESSSGNPDEALHRVRERCVFTTHTPVPAGHDRFEWELVAKVLGEPIPPDLFTALAGRERMNMTLLASNLSHFVNGVARRHREVSEHMFPGRDIRHITNGVHSPTWTSPSFRALFDRHIPEWRDDPSMLRKVLVLPPQEVLEAHAVAKQALLEMVRDRTARNFEPRRLTIGFARRATSYKRLDLVFHDLERLRAVGRGQLQLVFAGKAHPNDVEGKALIGRVFAAARELGDDVPTVYLADYDMDLAKTLVAGVDVWLNTPLPPLEASGTSGMKAAHNGVPSLSILDGWWLEGCVEGLTGWSIGHGDGSDTDAGSLYEQLEHAVLPAFRSERWTSIMQHTIALNASFFNTHRMVQQYVANAYLD